MKCPECNGVRFVTIPLLKGLIPCPTCEGTGKMPDIPATNWCSACGEPIKEGQKWCEFHKETEKFKSLLS